MLAEDEPPILFMMKAMIEEAHPSFKVRQWAFNGKDAWAMIQQQKPDVLITDIKMPFIGGLELVSKVKELDPQILCLILTGYNDFEYVRTALQLQACDYLLKPVKEEQLKQTLVKLADQLDQITLDAETALIKHYVNYGNGFDSRRYLGRKVELSYSYYNYFLVRAGAASKLEYDILNPGKEAIKLLQRKMVVDIVPAGTGVWIMEGPQLNEKIIVIGDPHLWEPNTSEQFADLLINHLRGLNSDIPFHVFTGQSVKLPELLREAIDQLRKIVHLCTRIHRSGLYPVIGVAEEQKENYLSPDLLAKCMQLVQENSYVHFNKSLMMWSVDWERKDFSQEKIEAILEAIVLKFEQYLGGGQLRSLNEFDANEIISTCTSIPQIVEEFGNYIKPNFERGSRVQQASAKDLVSRIEEYLNTHYMDPISNEIYQNIFGYNKNYISNVFSEVKGLPPSKYLMKLRIQKAKLLIEEHIELPLKTVAERVGYDDPLYFSRVFRNETGFSPKDYKEMLSRQREGESE
ncbi:response regulator transcription factor [Paenibacillus sp. HWE-109]|uniref:response regulator transcription factor n=1 Tax=Paenibacillus sp. HWE-109 TaxID=1306526 RepID=UPI0024B4FAED|nr:response regulator [Paenibacillus sp. HWE-109]